MPDQILLISSSLVTTSPFAETKTRRMSSARPVTDTNSPRHFSSRRVKSSRNGPNLASRMVSLVSDRLQKKLAPTPRTLVGCLHTVHKTSRVGGRYDQGRDHRRRSGGSCRSEVAQERRLRAGSLRAGKQPRGTVVCRPALQRNM